MTTYTEKAEAALPTMLERKKKADLVDVIAPEMLMNSMILADGDSSKGRQISCSLAPLVEFVPARDWAVNMVTNPGDAVHNPTKTYVYLYSGKAPMTHANPTFFPGASGVYYWSIVPKMKDGVKIYPNISGIVVAVKQNEIWWNVTMTKQFKWRGVDNNNCSWPPTQGNEWIEVPL